MHKKHIHKRTQTPTHTPKQKVHIHTNVHKHTQIHKHPKTKKHTSTYLCTQTHTPKQKAHKHTHTYKSKQKTHIHTNAHKHTHRNTKYTYTKVHNTHIGARVLFLQNPQAYSENIRIFEIIFTATYKKMVLRFI